MATEMTSFKPHLARAVYDWICENNYTPYVLVNAEYPGVLVPRQYVKKGVIVLNISPFAINAMNHYPFNDDGLEFEARFAGAARRIYVPIAAVQAIYAQENGAGKVFSEEEFPLPAAASSPDSNQTEGQPAKVTAFSSKNNQENNKAGPQLKIVKRTDSASDA